MRGSRCPERVSARRRSIDAKRWPPKAWRRCPRGKGRRISGGGRRRRKRGRRGSGRRRAGGRRVSGRRVSRRRVSRRRVSRRRVSRRRAGGRRPDRGGLAGRRLARRRPGLRRAGGHDPNRSVHGCPTGHMPLQWGEVGHRRGRRYACLGPAGDGLRSRRRLAGRRGPVGRGRSVGRRRSVRARLPRICPRRAVLGRRGLICHPVCRRAISGGRMFRRRTVLRRRALGRPG
jgi:hypothetical protein